MQTKKPDWLKIKVRSSNVMAEVESIQNRLSLHTVCDEASCPNRAECYNRKTATFMILGRLCTRNCTFCNVEKNKPLPPDESEPAHVAQAISELSLKHAVITSVTRDDLPDGGAGHFSKVIEEIKRAAVHTTIETLIPDFFGDESALAAVVNARPQVISHNIETVPRLYSSVRPMAVYERSLQLLRNVKVMNPDIFTKSSIMLGLGEEEDEVIAVLKDLRGVGCDFLTLGQYLAPSKKHHPVVEYIHPDIFEKMKSTGYELGFKHVASGPFVRSSYLADQALG